MRTARHVWIALGLAGAILAVYLQVRGHDFVNFDDYIYVVQNPNFEGGLTLANVVRAFTTPYAAYWIPLTWISLLIDLEVYGLHAAGFLLTNVALHIVATVLLYFFLVRTTLTTWRSAFVAAIFALHPLQVESVAWVTERKNVLSAVFLLTALHIHASRSRTRSTRTGLLLLGVTILGLLTKPALVTLPVMLLLLDYWPLGRLTKSPGDRLPDKALLWSAVKEKAPLFAAAIVAGAIAVYTQATMGGMELSERIPALVKITNALGSFLMYLVTAFWPAGLAALYPMPLVVGSWILPVLGAVALAGGTWLALDPRTARPYLTMGWIWFVLLLAPVLGFLHVGVQARADRFMYLPRIGLAIAVTWGLVAAARRWRTGPQAAAVAGAAALAVLSAIAWRQVGTWKDTVTLFEHAVAVTRDNAYAHNRLAEQYKSMMQLDLAESHYEETLRIDPGWYTPELQLANLREARGDPATAGLLRGAAERVRLNPSMAESAVGVAWMQAGRYRLARPLLERAVEKDPRSLGLHAALATVLTGLGEPKAALEHLDTAYRLDPDHPVIAANRAWLLAASPEDSVRNPNAAIQAAQAGLYVVTHLEYALLDALAAAHAATGRRQEALDLARRAAQMAAERGDGARAQAIHERILLYESGGTYRDASGDPSRP